MDKIIIGCLSILCAYEHWEITVKEPPAISQSKDQLVPLPEYYQNLLDKRMQRKQALNFKPACKQSVKLPVLILASIDTSFDSSSDHTIIATVAQNVLSANAKVIIPKGAKLICKFKVGKTGFYNKLYPWCEALVINNEKFLLPNLPLCDLNGSSGITGELLISLMRQMNTLISKGINFFWSKNIATYDKSKPFLIVKAQTLFLLVITEHNQMDSLCAY